MSAQVYKKKLSIIYVKNTNFDKRKNVEKFI